DRVQTATIENDDSAVITINDVSRVEGDSGESNMVFTVSTSAVVDTAVVLRVDTADGSATVADNDYVPVSNGTIQLGSGVLVEQFIVAIQGDELAEVDETFFLNLSELDATGRDVTLEDATGTGTILLDDAGVVLVEDELVVLGDGETNDTFLVKERAKTFKVFQNGKGLPPIPRESVSSVSIYTFEGNDQVVVRLKEAHDVYVDVGPGRDNVNVKNLGFSEIHAGTGNDKVAGGAGPDLIYGEGGKDQLKGRGGDDIVLGGTGADTVYGNGGSDIVIGEEGNDRVLGGSGRDLLIGGSGSDLMKGGSDDDLLIGSSTTIDADLMALEAVRLQWISDGTVEDRISAIKDEFLPLVNIVDDAAADNLFGNGDIDWGIQALDDILSDSPEFLDII
ncbi:MAG: Calx-beta domain-containing protein, partial [Planctomycetaceae bacterium]